MAKDLNQCNFIGRLGKDPDERSMPDGTAVTAISIACADDYKQDSRKVERTNWIRVVAFGKLAELFAQHLKKGSRVYVSGKMTTRKYTDNQNIERHVTEIVASEMQMLDGRQDGAQGGQYAVPQPARQQPSPQQQAAPAARQKYAAPQPPPAAFDDFEDDIPFN